MAKHGPAPIAVEVFGQLNAVAGLA